MQLEFIEESDAIKAREVDDHVMLDVGDSHEGENKSS